MEARDRSTAAQPRAWAPRAALAALGTLGGGAYAWVGYALTLSGDYFAAGPTLLIVMIAAAGSGGVLGWRVESRGARLALALVLALPLVFLASVRDGWWAHGPPPPSPPTPPAVARVLHAPESAPPSARDVLLALSAHADLDPPDASCTNLTGDLAGETLGVIEAHLLAQLAEASAEHDVAGSSATCEPSGPPWRCSFEVWVEVEEDPWRYGIQFTLDRSGAIDPASVRCPGTG